MAKPSIGMGESTSAKTCEAIDFKTAELVRAGDRVLLKVTGEAPHAGMAIEVRPVLYVMQPDYWLMALVACRPAAVKPSGAPASFAAEINVGGTVGRKGIELNGKPGGKAKRLELAG